MEKSKFIFGNEISNKIYNKALKAKKKSIKRFGDDSNEIYHLRASNNETLFP